MHTPFRWSVSILLVLVILYAVLPILMIINPEFLRAEIVRTRPGLSNTAIEFAIVAASIFAAGIHALFIGLYIWLFAMILKYRKWARIVLTILLMIATVGSFTSWTATAGPIFHGVIIATNVVHAILAGLLWSSQIPEQ